MPNERRVTHPDLPAKDGDGPGLHADAIAQSANVNRNDIVLSIAGLSKRFGKVWANDKISLEIGRGEVAAILGENGAGKTTLMSVLFGHYVADEGAIEVFGKRLPPGSPRAAIAAGIGMVHQHFTLAENLTVLDNIMIGTESLWRPWTSRRAAASRVAELARDFGLKVTLDALVADLSVGEKQRVEILKALYREARILILDEPTAVLTPQETNHLFATLKRLVARGLSVLFISHKLQEVMAVSDRVTVLRAGKVVADLRTAETSQTELAELMVGRTLPLPVREPMPVGAPVLTLEGVSVAAADGRLRLDGVDLTVHQHEIIGIAGVAGNGQGPLFDLVSGLTQASGGKVRVLGEALESVAPDDLVRRGVARIPEDRRATGLITDMAVWENAIAERYAGREFSHGGILRLAACHRCAEQIIRDFDVRCPSTSTPTRMLSGGNMQKLLLGRVLAWAPKLVIANQPTRGLDVGAFAYVHERLLMARAAGAGLLLISEDLDEIMALADRVAVIHRGRLSAPLPREQVSIRQLGLMMAGHFAEVAGDAA